MHALEVGRTPPRVFTLQLAWESQREEPGNIAATLAALSERVRARGCIPSGSEASTLWCALAYTLYLHW